MNALTKPYGGTKTSFRYAPDVFVGLVFCLVSAFLIISGNGVPYVFDGNETFSSILHARNFFDFDFSLAVGLADEATSPNPNAHPVAHTHQGNFPRIFATLIYALGAKSVEAQVILTTFTVGLGSVLVLFRVLRWHFGVGLAMTAMLLMITDYILFAQWQVVTYRVWHLAFLSLTLFTVSRYHDGGDRKWLFLMAPVWWGLFYYELAFAVFLSVSVGTWTLWLFRHSIGGAVKSIIVTLVGAVGAVATVIAQLIFYLGWQDFITDLSLTYQTRNNAAEGSDFSSRQRAFFEENNIAFFYNFMDGDLYRSFGAYVDAFFKWGFQVYTPALALAFLTILTGAILRHHGAAHGVVRAPSMTILSIFVLYFLHWAFPGSFYILVLTLALVGWFWIYGRTSSTTLQMIDKRPASMILWAGATVLFSAIIFDERVLGLRPVMTEGPRAMLAMLVASVVVAGWVWSQFLLRRVSGDYRQIEFISVLRVSLFNLLVVGFMGIQFKLYDQSLSGVWYDALTDPLLPHWAQKIGLLLCVLTVSMWLMPSAAVKRFYVLPLCVRNMGALVACFMIGFAVALVMFPGYIFSGYMFRFAPFLFFPLVLICAMGLFVLGHDVVRRYTEHRDKTRSGLRPAYRLAELAVPALTLVFIVVFWGNVQVGGAVLFPANSFSVIENLKNLKSPNPTIVSNTYTAPFSIVTGNWSYLDHDIGDGKVIRTEQGLDHARDDRYRWFADRSSNPDYDRPTHFVCFMPRTYWTAAFERAKNARPDAWCSNLGLLRLASQEPDKIWPDHRVVAKDSTGSDLWAIVELDWNFSPYIYGAPAVAIDTSQDDRNIVVSYEYRQQDGLAEVLSRLRLYPVRQDGRYCEITGDPVSTSEGHGGRGGLKLSRKTPDTLILGVRPSTETRIGVEAFSKPFIMRGDDVQPFQGCDFVRLTNGDVVDLT